MEATMKRDWDLIRAILARLEDREPNAPAVGADEFPGYTPSVVAYHFELLSQAGLMACRIISNTEERYAGGMAIGITWDGHEFLSKIRSDTVWAKVKKSIADKGLTLGFDVIKTAAMHYVKLHFPV